MYSAKDLAFKSFLEQLILTFPAPRISENCIEVTINYNFIFTLLCGASKDFIKILKTFIEPFEAPQRSVKVKI